MSSSRRAGTRRRGPAFDVVFFAPWIGPLLVPGTEPTLGGAENQIAMLARQLARDGYRVCVIAFDVSGLPSSADGVSIARVPALDGASRPVRAARLVRAIVGRRGRVMVQRAAGIETGVVGLLARVTGRRFVYSSASDADFRFEQVEPLRWRLRLFHLGVRVASQIVVQTEEQVGLCQERFGRRPLLIKSIAEPAPRLAGARDAFLWVGRLSHYKRPEDFIRLAEALPDARFRIVAAGSEGDLRERASALSNVEWLEPRPRTALFELMESAVAVVNTSDYEGMPNVFLEGWARGVPALSLRHDPGGVIERCRLGAFAGGDFDRFVTDARTMWETRDDTAAVAERCRAYVAAEHDPGVVVRQWIDALEL
ncbi:MAG: hypothetical protein QOJ12_1880 [Thermoleophilales bacterium]|nr:hypothetical protein [Thermoleophilales bacterium]